MFQKSLRKILCTFTFLHFFGKETTKQSADKTKEPGIIVSFGKIILLANFLSSSQYHLIVQYDSKTSQYSPCFNKSADAVAQSVTSGLNVDKGGEFKIFGLKCQKKHTKYNLHSMFYAKMKLESTFQKTSLILQYEIQRNSFFNSTQLYIYETKHFNYVTHCNIEGVVYSTVCQSI